MGGRGMGKVAKRGGEKRPPRKEKAALPEPRRPVQIALQRMRQGCYGVGAGSVLAIPAALLGEHVPSPRMLLALGGMGLLAGAAGVMMEVFENQIFPEEEPMAPEYNDLRGLRHPASRISPTAAVALFLTTAAVWVFTTRPSLPIGRLGSGARLSLEQWALLFSTVFGAAVLIAGLFAIAVYAVHWPAIEVRRMRQQLVDVRADLAALKADKDRLVRRVEALQRLRNEIAMLDTQLHRVREGSVPAQEARRVVANGLEVVDDIIAELEAARV